MLPLPKSESTPYYSTTGTGEATTEDTKATEASGTSETSKVAEVIESSKTPEIEPADSDDDKCRRCRGFNYCHYLSHPGFKEMVSDRGNALVECQYHLDFVSRARHERHLKQSGVPTQYFHLGFEDYPLQSSNEAALVAAFEFIKSPECLYLRGASRSGKTLLVSLLTNELLRRSHSASVIYITSTELLMKLNYLHPEHESRLERLQEIPTLIIDDLGTERSSRYNGEQLSMILEGRRRLGHSTILTSEASKVEIGELYAHEGSHRLGQLLRDFREVPMNSHEV